MTTHRDSPMRSKDGWLNSISTVLHVGRNARSVRLARANRGKLLGEQKSYRYGFCGYDDR